MAKSGKKAGAAKQAAGAAGSYEDAVDRAEDRGPSLPPGTCLVRKDELETLLGHVRYLWPVCQNNQQTREFLMRIRQFCETRLDAFQRELIQQQKAEFERQRELQAAKEAKNAQAPKPLPVEEVTLPKTKVEDPSPERPKDPEPEKIED